jgi:hypothetical protein
MLVTPGSLATGRRLRPTVPPPARRTARDRRTPLVSRPRGRLPRPRGKTGGATGPSPVERRKPGSKHHLIRDGKGARLKVITTVANVNDNTRTLALVGGIPPVAGLPSVHAGDPMPYSATRRTTRRPCGTNCSVAGSHRWSPAGAARTSRAWASSATSSSRPRAFAGHPGADTEGGSPDVLTHLDQPGISTARQEVSAAGPDVQGRLRSRGGTPNDSKRGDPRPASQARGYTLICEEPR